MNIRAKEALLSALSDAEMTNVMELESADQIWGNLQILYEGNATVKMNKL